MGWGRVSVVLVVKKKKKSGVLNASRERSPLKGKKSKNPPPPPAPEKSQPLSGLHNALVQEGAQKAGSPQPLPAQGGWHTGHGSKEVDVWIDSEAHPAWALEDAERDSWCAFKPTACSSLSRGTCPGR